jgi:hypothetical protein
VLQRTAPLSLSLGTFGISHMQPNLIPAETLSQVVFVHDYFQLVFQDETFNIYNFAEVVREGAILRQGQVGFCDAAVGLIGEKVVSFTTAPTGELVLRFASGVSLRVIGGLDGQHGFPHDAWEYHGPNGLIACE